MDIYDKVQTTLYVGVSDYVPETPLNAILCDLAQVVGGATLTGGRGLYLDDSRVTIEDALTITIIHSPSQEVEKAIQEAVQKLCKLFNQKEVLMVSHLVRSTMVARSAI